MLNPHVVVRIDDILIIVGSDAEHLSTPEKVLHRLEATGLHLKQSKCFFVRPEVMHLGNRMD